MPVDLTNLVKVAPGEGEQEQQGEARVSGCPLSAYPSPSPKDQGPVSSRLAQPIRDKV
jgi:hypothetical protein